LCILIWPWITNTAFAYFSDKTFIMESTLDKVFFFSSRDVRTEDKNKKFDLIKSKLTSILRSAITFWADYIDKP